MVRGQSKEKINTNDVFFQYFLAVKKKDFSLTLNGIRIVRGFALMRAVLLYPTFEANEWIIVLEVFFFLHTKFDFSTGY